MSRRSGVTAIAIAVVAQVALLIVYQSVERGRTDGAPVTMERRSEPGHDLVVERPDGSRIAIPARAGRYQIIHFWATWCPPCVKEIPSISALARHDPGRLRVWAVSADPKWGSVEGFFRDRVPDHVVRDSGGASARAYTVRGLPDSYLLDPEGRVVARFAGGQDWTSEEMRRILDALLSEG